MKIDFLSPGAPQWKQFLGRTRHDMYHLAAYATLSATVAGGEAFAVLAQDESDQMFLPLIFREIPNSKEPSWDAASPYGYPGPLVTAAPTRRDDFVAKAFEATGISLRSRGCVSLFIRTHPLLGPIPRPPGASVVRHGQTVYIDLLGSEETIWRGTRASHRNEIRQSRRAGYQVYIDDQFKHFGVFVDMYEATMQRLHADENYFFDHEYYGRLRDALGSSLKLAVVEIEGQLAATGLFVETCGIVQYHLSGTNVAFASARPTKLMLDYVRTWAKLRGNTVMHLGGGLGGAEDSLFRFKAGFSKHRSDFHTVRMILNEPLYCALSQATASDRGGIAPAKLGFFPAYRLI